MGTRTRRRMLTLVGQWETSGETRRAFADRHGVTLSCFDYWRRHVLDARRDEPVEFAPVRVVSDEAVPGAGVIEVVLAGGERVVIREGASGDLVRHVISVLRASCERSRLQSGSTWRLAPRICAARSMDWRPSCVIALISIRSLAICFSSVIGVVIA